VKKLEHLILVVIGLVALGTLIVTISEKTRSRVARSIPTKSAHVKPNASHSSSSDGRSIDAESTETLPVPVAETSGPLPTPAPENLTEAAPTPVPQLGIIPPPPVPR